MEEDKEEEEKDEKKDEKKDDEKEEKKEEKKKGPKIQSSSTSNEVKQIETQEETTKQVVETLQKELEECESAITKNNEESVSSTANIVVDEGDLTEEKSELAKTTRRKLRQQCAVKFPAVFTQFSKQRSLRNSGKCPCQGGATGISLIQTGVDAPEEADKIVQNLFAKKLATEAKFLV